MTGLTDAQREGRWRCKDCGSTRVRVMVEAYIEGRADNANGETLFIANHERVEDHDDPATVLAVWCANCQAEGADRMRYEREALSVPAGSTEGER